MFWVEFTVSQKHIVFGPEATIQWTKADGGFIPGDFVRSTSKNIMGGLFASYDFTKKAGAGFRGYYGINNFTIRRPNAYWNYLDYTVMFDISGNVVYTRKTVSIAPFISLNPIRELRFQIGPYFNIAGKSTFREYYGYNTYYGYFSLADKDYLNFENNFKKIESGLKLSLSWEIPIGILYRLNLTGSWSRGFDYRKDKWLNIYSPVFSHVYQNIADVQLYHLKSESLNLKYWNFAIGFSRVIPFGKNAEGTVVK